MGAERDIGYDKRGLCRVVSSFVLSDVAGKMTNGRWVDDKLYPPVL